jgi:endonuclease III-like uncharacterized protein
MNDTVTMVVLPQSAWEQVLQKLERLSAQMEKAPQKEQERMPVQKLVEYLALQGYYTTITTIYSYVNQKKIPYSKINRKLIFERKQIDVWLKENGKHIKTSKNKIIP